MRHFVTRLAFTGLALAASLTLGACVPESENPVAGPDEKSDPRLWGTWLSVAEDGYVVADVLATEGGKLEITFIEHDVEGIGSVEKYEAHASLLPSGDYLNVLVTGDESGYVVGKYAFKETDEVSIGFVDMAKLEPAVKSGALPGILKPEQGGNDVRITASPEQWQAFLKNAPADLFTEPSVFTRVGPAFVEQQ